MCLLFLLNYKQIWFSSADFQTSPNIKFQGNPSGGSHADIHVEE
jgi:hypothetical protein